MNVPAPVVRSVQKMAGSKIFEKVGPHFVPQLDRFLHRISGGRILLSKAIVPSLVLTTTGRKTGQPRPVPLACLPAEKGIYVVASNYGRESHPAWSANLMANPQATVSFGRETFDVTAVLLDGAAKVEVWPRLIEVWPVYDRYEDKSGRDLRVFRLERR